MTCSDYGLISACGYKKARLEPKGRQAVRRQSGQDLQASWRGTAGHWDQFGRQLAKDKQAAGLPAGWK